MTEVAERDRDAISRADDEVRGGGYLKEGRSEGAVRSRERNTRVGRELDDSGVAGYRKEMEQENG